MRYAVVPFRTPADPEEFQRRVEEVDDAAYMQYHPTIYFLSYSGTPTALAKRLGIASTDDKPGKPALVVAVESYSGYGNRDLWRWLEGGDK